MGQPQPRFCSCEECQRLDRLPIRRHGIPGARQLLLPAGGLPVAPAPLAALAPAPQADLEGLALFAGALEPTLI